MNVFITGATGYIGGATLALLLTKPETKIHNYSALVRNSEKAAVLDDHLGVRPVLGSLDDAELLTEEASKPDDIIHTADSADHVVSCAALLAGMKKQKVPPIYIHISGTGEFIDDARGEYATETIYSDLDTAKVNALPPTAFHRNVDLMVLNASSEFNLRTHIIMPSTIYGVADHLLVKKDISNAISIQMPLLIRAGIGRGQGGVLGKGLNLWPNIHISEIAEIIVLVFEKALEGKTATGWDGYYFGESGEYSQLDAAREVSKALAAKGIGKSEPTPFTDEDIKKYYGGKYYLGTNSRCRGERVRALGWKPTHSNEEFLKSLGPEVDYILEFGNKTH